MCQLEFAAKYQNYCWNGKTYHTATKKCSTIHIAWMNYGCRLTRISISGIFDKAEWNLTMWEAEGNRKFTDQFTSIDAFAEKMSKWVTVWEMMKIGRIGQCNSGWLQQIGWLIPYFLCGSYSLLKNTYLFPFFCYKNSDVPVSKVAPSCKSSGWLS